MFVMEKQVSPSPLALLQQGLPLLKRDNPSDLKTFKELFKRDIAVLKVNYPFSTDDMLKTMVLEDWKLKHLQKQQGLTEDAFKASSGCLKETTLRDHFNVSREQTLELYEGLIKSQKLCNRLPHLSEVRLDQVPTGISNSWKLPNQESPKIADTTLIQPEEPQLHQKEDSFDSKSTQQTLLSMDFLEKALERAQQSQKQQDLHKQQMSQCKKLWQQQVRPPDFEEPDDGVL